MAALFFIILSSFIPVRAEMQSLSIEVVENGNPLKNIELALIEGMGYLKAREAADVFDAELDYIQEGGQIIYSWPLRGEEKKVVFEVGNFYVSMEGVRRRMMKSPLIINGRAYIPLEAVITRAFQNVIEGVVRWSFTDRTLWLSRRGGIRDIRNYSYDNYSRFVIETAGEPEFSSRRRRNRWEISFDNTPVVFPYEGQHIGDGVIEKVETEKKEKGVKFIVHLGRQAGEVRISKNPSPPRLVMDVENSRPAKEDKKKTRPESLQAELALRDRTEKDDIELVVIDPGHGGRDPGAIGAMGVREKDVVLAIAKKLASKIRGTLNIRAELTRTGDYFIPLAERTEIANKKGADLFISIHANSSLNPQARGVEIYFLSEEASDAEAAAVAARENSVVAMEERSREMDRLTKILWSLTLNQFMNESSQFASIAYDKISSGTGLPGRGVKQAGFYVMKGARMPAVLVEAGFLSNREEERLLNTGAFQSSVARSILSAIQEYREALSGQ